METSISLESLGIDKLSAEEKWKLLDQIWQSLPADLHGVNLPTWHLDILEQRLASSQTAASDKGWELLKDELRNSQ